MTNDFDKILANKIKQSFDEYSPDYSPANWDLLKAKLAKKKRRKILLYIISGAAAVLVFGIIFSSKFYYTQTNQFANENTKILLDTTAKKIHNPIHKTEITSTLTEKNIQEKTGLDQKSKNQKTVLIQKINSKNSIPLPKQNQLSNTNSIVTQIAKQESIDKFTVNLDSSEIRIVEPLNSSSEITSELTFVEEKTIIDSIITPNTIEAPKIEIAEKDEIFYEDSEDENKANKLNLSVLLSSQVNNSKTINNPEVNLGGGVLTDLALVKKADLQVGMIVSKQSVNFINESLQSNFKTPEESNLQFLSFTIPCNLKYNISEKPTREIFVSAGVSSIGYINENYEYNYQVTTTETSYQVTADGIQAVEQEISYDQKENVEISGMNKFDFAGQLNLSGGVAYNLSSKMKLHIEPYFKFPLRKLATDNILYTTGGINLYLKFWSGKK